MTTPRKLAAGNWKMNGTASSLDQIDRLVQTFPNPACDILVCPPATLIRSMYERAAGSSIMVGGQDCHASASGAHTGDLSAAMLADAGASHVILGHSERRADHGETDEQVRAKAQAALDAGLIAVVCVGETAEQRDDGRAVDVVVGQLDGSVPADITADTMIIAYEPVWAIGTGRVPTTDQIAEIHRAMRQHLGSRHGAEIASRVSLLYGGSVKAANAEEIFATDDVDGALVGGASLKAEDFSGIIAALEAAV